MEYITDNNKTYPKVEVIRDWNILRFKDKCPYCQKIHTHGGCNLIPGAGDGDRCAHCTYSGVDSSKIYPGDYWLIEVGVTKKTFQTMYLYHKDKSPFISSRVFDGVKELSKEEIEELKQI